VSYHIVYIIYNALIAEEDHACIISVHGLIEDTNL